jgi:hypothetical protein
MSVGKVLIAFALAGLAWLGWQRHNEHLGAAASAAITDSLGFITLVPPDGTSPAKVLIVAAQNCPKEGARRAENLAQQLAALTIPHSRLSRVAFTPPADDPSFAGRLNTIMNSEVPLVFVNGKVKSNPDLEEVVAEYEAMSR